MNTPVVLFVTTLPDTESARQLAERALGERLAACVTQLGAVRSQYHWQGKLETADEIQLMFKTSLARAPELARFIESNHPYDTPEILSWQALASSGYGGWVNAETYRPLHV